MTLAVARFNDEAVAKLLYRRVPPVPQAHRNRCSRTFVQKAGLSTALEVFLLLTACVIAPATQAKTGAAMTYAYSSELNQDSDLCKRMAGVFNTKFANLWKRDAFSSMDASHYTAGSKYAFPLLPGVSHASRFTFDMSLSRSPSSEEFDAIDWKEGRVTTGSPSASKTPDSETSLPVLIANIDIDNDGSQDTIVKYGFSPGYEHLASGEGLSAEAIVVWRSQVWQLPADLSLWKLLNSQPATRAPIVYNAAYLRPFVYNRHTYLARYDFDRLTPEGKRRTKGGHPRETMSVVDVRFTGTLNGLTKRPEWTATTLCSYRMEARSR